MPQLLGIRLATTWAAAALLAAGCASSPRQSNAGGDSGVDRAVTKTSEGLDDAALTPLTDFNLRRTEIPKRLEAIVSPYEPLKARTCEAIATEVNELTIILGPDSDAPVGARRNAEPESWRRRGQHRPRQSRVGGERFHPVPFAGAGSDRGVGP